MFCEYADWPESLRALSFNRPFARYALDYDRAGDRLEIYAPDLADHCLPAAVFPKLGPKSWREEAGPVCAGTAAALTARLAQPTAQQLCLVAAITRADAPLWLTLSRARDFAGISEYRLHVDGARVLRQRCLVRGELADTGEVRAFALRVAAVFDRPVSLDIAWSQADGLSLIDVNPLTGHPETVALSYHVVEPCYG